MPKGELTGTNTCDDTIAEVWYHMRQYDNATSRTNAAYHLTELYNKVGDLASWHLNYDEDSGEIKGVYEDDE